MKSILSGQISIQFSVAEVLLNVVVKVVLYLQENQPWFVSILQNILRHVYQRSLIEEKADILNSIHKVLIQSLKIVILEILRSLTWFIGVIFLSFRRGRVHWRVQLH